MTRAQFRTAAAVLAVIGILGVVIGIVYLSVTATDLPSFMPGHVNGLAEYRKGKGDGGLGLGLGLLVAAGVAFLASRER